jgi:hypothetical protein
MMRQPLLGVGFTTYAPLALLPYMVRIRGWLLCAPNLTAWGPFAGRPAATQARPRERAARPDRRPGAQALLLWVGAFNRLAGVFVRRGGSVWEDDYEVRSPAAAQARAPR